MAREKPARNGIDESFRDAGNQLLQSSRFTRERWDRITEILSAASELAPESRSVYIIESCGSDAALRAEVERLMRELDNMSGFLEQATVLSAMDAQVEPGTQLGPYLLGEKVGEGGMGIVFEAVDSRLGRRVAVKVLRGKSLGDASGRQRFFQEARMMATLNHASVVTIYDVGTSGNHDFIAMEYVAGKSLDRLLAETRLPLAKALTYARQVVSALSLAHSLGIVHRDLKPGNIIIGGDDVARVLDFGLAKWSRGVAAAAASSPAATCLPSIAASDFTIEGDIFGTVAYMSPEQAAGSAVDERSDVFSFGAVLYEMISGRKAFGRGTQLEILRAIAQEQPAGLRHASPPVPRAIEEIVFSCLKRDPAERPSIDAVLAALEAAARGSRRTTWRVVAAVFMLAAVSGAAVWVSRENVASEPVQLLARPITSYPGDEVGVSFSPDGTQIAFAWQREKERVFHVYTRAVDSGEALPLTTGESHHPAWSPSAKEIAFLRDVGGHDSIFVIPAEGGVAREIVSTGTSSFILSPALSWSDDSKWIAYSGRDPDTGGQSIFAVARETRVVRRLTRAKPGEIHVQPALSRDGKLLAFAVDRDGVSTINFVKLKSGIAPDGDVQELRFHELANTVCSNPVWAPDGGELLFLANRGAILSLLWSAKVDASGRVGSPRLLGNLGEGAYALAVSQSGKRLAFTRHMSNENLNLVSLSGAGSGASQPLLASAYREAWPRYSPDGKRIAFESDRGGFPEVWLANADGSGAFALTNLHGPVTGSPAWSPDGRQLAFDTRASGEPQVYVIRAEKGAEAQLITTGKSNFLPAWSADGRSVYFVSNRTGDSNIWRVPARGGPAVQISRSFAFAPIASPDGKYLYFFAGRSQHAPIHRIDLTTLAEEPLIENAMDRAISITRRGLYFLQRHSDETTVTLQLFDPSLNRDFAIQTLPAKLNGGLEVTRDDRAVLVSANDFMATDLMLVEDFH